MDGRAENAAAGRPFDVRVFEQGQWWVEPDGRVHRVSELRRSERAALLRWLRANARHFYVQAVKAELIRLLAVGEDCEGADSRPSPGDKMSSLLFSSAEDWLESTALVRALSRWDW